ncbi:DMT family transporter [Nocardioides sp. 503]|uniref:DMT family transporter n=1 Tax=Nocardioides sp. 503 TaxID=2508326 RepID=UPI00106F0B7D|nr:DMT family transporter [Nocardioides sp. 503]
MSGALPAAGSRRAPVAVAFAVLALAWGLTPITIKAGLLEDWQPLWFCGLRLLTAALVLCPLLLTRWAGEPLGLPGWRVVWPIGVFGMAVNFGITVWGQQYIGAALASLIVGTQPITTTLIVHLIRRDAPTRRFVLSLLLGAAGMVVVFRGAGVPGSMALAGALAVFAGVSVYGGVYVFINARVGRLNLIRVVAGQNLVGGVLVSLAALAIEGAPAVPSAPAAWLPFGYLVLISSIVALLLANWLIARMGAARFSVLSFVTPLVGVVASVLLLGESIDAGTLLGGGLIGVALLFALGPGAPRGAATSVAPECLACESEPGPEDAATATARTAGGR